MPPPRPVIPAISPPASPVRRMVADLSRFTSLISPEELEFALKKRVLIPVRIRTRAKMRRTVFGLICCTMNEEERTPSIIPKARSAPQSNLVFLPKRLKLYVLTMELKKITERDVPMTTEGGTSGNSPYKTGTIKTPPPTPKKADRRPTKNPVKDSMIKSIDPKFNWEDGGRQIWNL